MFNFFNSKDNTDIDDKKKSAVEKGDFTYSKPTVKGFFYAFLGKRDERVVEFIRKTREDCDLDISENDNILQKHH